MPRKRKTAQPDTGNEQDISDSKGQPPSKVRQPTPRKRKASQYDPDVDEENTA